MSTAKGWRREARRAVVIGATVPLLAGCGARLAPLTPTVHPRVIAAYDTGTTAIATALAFPGSAWELPGKEGLTLLTAETLLEGEAYGLGALGARAEVRCERGLFTVTLVAPPETWAIATDLLLAALFRPDPDQQALDRARARLRRSLALDLASPAWQGRLAPRQALYADSLASTVWNGPACGVPETLDLFDLDDIRAGAYRFAPRMARAAVVGAADTAAARALVSRWLPPTPPPALPAPRQVVAGRRFTERNTVTAWTALAFPFGPDADLDAIRLLAALLEEAVEPGVARPDVFSTSHEIEVHGRGGALILHVVTAPGVAAESAGRVVSRVAAIAESGVGLGQWERVLRRHRGERLGALERPEARAARMVRALALEGRQGGVGAISEWPRLNALSPARVQAAAGALGDPARAVIGPRAAWESPTP